MRHPSKRSALLSLAVVLACTLALPGPVAWAADAGTLPAYLRDRGAGIPTSMFGTYIRQGEWLVYPFAEWYADRNIEYKPSELGYAGDDDHRGKYSASENLLFVAYGITDHLAVELEGARITAELTKSTQDPSLLPHELEATGTGDIEGQIRWQFRDETERHGAAFLHFESVFPTQPENSLIGTTDWEHKLGVGTVRGHAWGTMTFRAAVEYSAAENKLEYGEYAIEYLRRLSPAFRVVSVIEGNQLDEVEWINELQVRLMPRATLKMNTGIGVTPNATDVAPELGVLFSF